MRVLLLGGTDLTLAIARSLEGLGFGPAGVVHIPPTFAISYSPGGLNNVRHADLAAWCDDHSIPAFAYDGAASLAEAATATQAEFCLAAGWYHMVPRRIRALFPKGTAGLHASLLPCLRGGAPLNWALLSGARKTGVTLFELDEGVDDGAIWDQEAFAIEPRATIGDLVRLAESASVRMVRRCLPRIADGRWSSPRPQVGVPSYGLARTPDDGLIKWSGTAAEIDRLIRAVGRPYPGAFTWLDDRKVTVWAAEPLDTPVTVHGAPGQIARLPGHEHPLVVTAAGLLSIREADGPEGEDALSMLLRSANRRLGDSSTPNQRAWEQPQAHRSGREGAGT